VWLTSPGLGAAERTALAYIDARDVQNRLTDVMGRPRACPRCNSKPGGLFHQAIEDTIAIERVVRSARRERRKIGRRAVVKLAPLIRGPRRGGSISM